MYVSYLRKKGVRVGEGTKFFGPGSCYIDVGKPCLVEIGRHCIFTQGTMILTHSYDWTILREKYGEIIASSQKVIIEDNVFVGVNSIILKGVRIGRNTIIGAGSIVTHDIPSDSVAAGVPCQVIMGIDDYYKRRKREYIEEAKAYALEIYKKTGEVPQQEAFWDEFPLFLEREGTWGKLPVKEQLGSAFNSFMKSKPLYRSFRDFLIAAGIPAEEIEQSKVKRG